MNKYLIGLLVLVAGVLAGWYFLKGNAAVTTGTPVASPTAAMVEEKTATGAGESAVATSSVTYADSGFSPKMITVKVGTAVTFTNQSAGSMWVASDLHPTHQLLPGFDELKAVVTGGSYQYTFVKVGTWTYHNHMKPSDTGTVIVTE